MLWRNSLVMIDRETETWWSQVTGRAIHGKHRGAQLQKLEAIETIASSGQKLTILIIAHRLTTISSADNLLFFKSRSELVHVSKGTTAYDDIFERLKSIQYATGNDDKEEDDTGDMILMNDKKENHDEIS